MATLSAQIEEMEEALDSAQSEIYDLRRKVSGLEEDVDELEAEAYEFRDYIAWIDATYPEARTAYEAKQRLDSATV